MNKQDNTGEEAHANQQDDVGSRLVLLQREIKRERDIAASSTSVNAKRSDYISCLVNGEAALHAFSLTLERDRIARSSARINSLVAAAEGGAINPARPATSSIVPSQLSSQSAHVTSAGTSVSVSQPLIRPASTSALSLGKASAQQQQQQQSQASTQQTPLSNVIDLTANDVKQYGALDADLAGHSWNVAGVGTSRLNQAGADDMGMPIRAQRSINKLLKPQKELVEYVDDKYGGGDTKADAQAWSKKVLANVGKIPLMRSSLRRLTSGTWLDDDIASSYGHLINERTARLQSAQMALLQQQQQQQQKKRRSSSSSSSSILTTSYCLPACFYTKLAEGDVYDYAKVKQYTTTSALASIGCTMDSVLDSDRLCVFVCKDAHWTLVVINFRETSISQLDSLQLGANSTLVDNLLHWLRDEASDKQGRSIDTAGWTRKYPLVPQQQNTNDCGVFALVFANYICISRKFDFDHKDMDFFRCKILWQIVRGFVE